MEDELYVTCVCGALVNEANVSQHVEDCLKQEFVKRSVTLKISKPNAPRDVSPKERHICSKCIRCGHPMSKNKGTLITFNPSVQNSSIACCSYKCKSEFCGTQTESLCSMCKLPNEFHEGKSVNEEDLVNCINDLKSGEVNEWKDEKTVKCREEQATLPQYLETTSENDEDTESRNAPEHEHSLLNDEVPSGPPCKLFHVALLPNYSRDHVGTSDHNYSLLLQIVDDSPTQVSVQTQTDLQVTRDAGTQVKILGVYPEEVRQLLDGQQGYDVPDFDPHAEAAFRSHLSTLIPCTHCSRTFSPDRVQRHESCCIERPRSRMRDCITPMGGEILR